nr:CoA-binding protein [Actinomycetota bacterium]
MRGLYEETSTIAVVGCSANPDKPANKVPRYLQEVGYRIVPVNPREEMILGERSPDALGEVDVAVDLVVVFRPADEAPQIAADAVSVGA